MAFTIQAILARHVALLASRACLMGILGLVLSALTFATAFAAERGRVRVQNGTVISDRNTILRGARMRLTDGYVANESYWKYLNSTLGLNAVRYGVKTSQIGRTVEQQLPSLDTAVERAARSNMYLMITNAIKPGSYDINELKKFWTIVAPRYKDRSHVFYEMTNEPVRNGPSGYWGSAEQYTDKVITDLKSVYSVMRRGAPNTHIVLFSTANLYPDCNTYAAMIAKMRGIDWSRASVGFHHYRGTEKFGESGLRCLRTKYPLIMTETNYWSELGRAPLRNALSLYEKLRISWFSYDGDRGAYRLQNEIIPALHDDGYYWQPEN